MGETAIKARILKLTALLISVIPPAACTLLYFPLWQSRDTGAVVSGSVLLLLLICAVPLLRAVRRVLASPSAPVIWFFLFVMFFMMARIADEMTVIAFVGFVSNFLGALLFKRASRLGRSKDGDVKNEEQT